MRPCLVKLLFLFWPARKLPSGCKSLVPFVRLSKSPMDRVGLVIFSETAILLMIKVGLYGVAIVQHAA
jgi:hypothetical protein